VYQLHCVNHTRFKATNEKHIRKIKINHAQTEIDNLLSIAPTVHLTKSGMQTSKAKCDKVNETSQNYQLEPAPDKTLYQNFKAQFGRLKYTMYLHDE